MPPFLCAPANKKLATTTIRTKRIPVVLILAALLASACISFRSEAKEHHDAGVAFYDQGKFEEAVAEFNLSIELDPDFISAYNNLGLAYDKLEDFDRAIGAYTKAIALGPNEPTGYYNRSFAYNSLGDYAAALEDLDRAIELDPKHGAAFLGRGVIYIEIGEYQRAVDDLTVSLMLLPDEYLTYGDRGLAYLKLEDFEAAVADFTSVVGFLPEEAFFYGQRGLAYLGLAEYDKALVDFETAVELNDLNWFEIGLERARVLVLVGQYEQAISTSRSLGSSTIRPLRIAYAQLNTSLAYEHQGDLEQASAHLELAIDLYWNEVSTAETIRYLEEIRLLYSNSDLIARVGQVLSELRSR